MIFIFSSYLFFSYSIFTILIMTRRATSKVFISELGLRICICLKAETSFAFLHSWPTRQLGIEREFPGGLDLIRGMCKVDLRLGITMKYGGRI